MSHHFDTPTAKEDPRLNLCDFYLFQGTPDTTVMAMTVNPDAGLSAPDTFREEALYAFRFDLNHDATEELTFKFRFAEPQHAAAADDAKVPHAHIQNFQVRKATGDAALRGADGELLLEAQTGKISTTSGIKVYAGLAPDLFAGDAAALHNFLEPFYEEKRFNPAAFQHRQNYFARRNVTAIVLEVPNQLLAQGQGGTVHAWATASLYGHAPEVQVSRWGLPLMTHIFLNDPNNQDLREKFNRAVPAQDAQLFSSTIAAFIATMTTYAAATPNPTEYAHRLTARLCPTMLPYKIATPASFTPTGFNGRPLTADAMDVMLTLAANTPLADGVAPDPTRTLPDFPYFGAPYSAAEQSAVTPASRPATPNAQAQNS